MTLDLAVSRMQKWPSPSHRYNHIMQFMHYDFCKSVMLGSFGLRFSWYDCNLWVHAYLINFLFPISIQFIISIFLLPLFCKLPSFTPSFILIWNSVQVVQAVSVRAYRTSGIGPEGSVIQQNEMVGDPFLAVSSASGQSYFSNSPEEPSINTISAGNDDIFETGIRIRPREHQNQPSNANSGWQGTAPRRIRLQKKLQVGPVSCGNFGDLSHKEENSEAKTPIVAKVRFVRRSLSVKLIYYVFNNINASSHFVNPIELAFAGWRRDWTGCFPITVEDEIENSCPITWCIVLDFLVYVHAARGCGFVHCRCEHVEVP